MQHAARCTLHAARCTLHAARSCDHMTEIGSPQSPSLVQAGVARL
ncbi:succinylglutamate desuccinylase [Burkholderia stabilis]|nr:succinylglutamate desuccinylase [Burkholderia stabilis]